MAKGLEVGDIAPDFELESTQGPIRLSERIGQGPVLLVFYPGDETAVCTKQLCDYRDNLSVFADLGVQVLAINNEDLSTHEAFAENHGLPFPLVSDPERRACNAYAVTAMFGFTKRALFLIGRDGRVKYKRIDLPIFRRTAAELQEVMKDLDLGAA